MDKIELGLDLHKFVRVRGEYRFSPYKSHAELAAGDEVEAAGAVGVQQDYIRVMMYDSTTLKVRSDAQCWLDIAEMTGKRVIQEWD